MAKLNVFSGMILYLNMFNIIFEKVLIRMFKGIVHPKNEISIIINPVIPKPKEFHSSLKHK